MIKIEKVLGDYCREHTEDLKNELSNRFRLEMASSDSRTDGKLGREDLHEMFLFFCDEKSCHSIILSYYVWFSHEGMET
jgi:hypothetical protein